MKITIVTPAKKGDRSGNRATANRWSAILKKLPVIGRAHSPEYDGAPSDAMLAIHAWRSASSIRRFRKDHPHIPLILCLAGPTSIASRPPTPRRLVPWHWPITWSVSTIASHARFRIDFTEAPHHSTIGPADPAQAPAKTQVRDYGCRPSTR